MGVTSACTPILHARSSAQRSERRYVGPLTAVYPPHVLVKRVSRIGHVSLNGETYFVSESLAGHDVGLEQVDDLHCKVWFHHIDCGNIEVLPQWMDDLVTRPRARDLKRKATGAGAQAQVRNRKKRSAAPAPGYTGAAT